jgi:hypothetical protein
VKIDVGPDSTSIDIAATLKFLVTSANRKFSPIKVRRNAIAGGTREQTGDSIMSKPENNVWLDIPSLIDAASATIDCVQKKVREYISIDPVGAFETVSIGKGNKPLLAIDLFAEMTATIERRNRLGQIRDDSLDLSYETNVIALLDIIDGTDLLERSLSNWCSAMVFYYPPRKMILSAKS